MRNGVTRCGLPGDDVWGLGDTTQSFFFTPHEPGPSGIIWGIGPIFLLPTATDERLGSGKWGQPHLVLRRRRRQGSVDSTFLQPFLSYALGGGQTLSLNTETTYDWTAGQWTVPINADYSKVFHIGTQAISWQAGVRYYAEKPEGGPDWGIRTGITFIIPEQ